MMVIHGCVHYVYTTRLNINPKMLAQVVVWSSGTATVQAIWCHDISVAWVRIPARKKQNICESKFTDRTLLGWCLDELYIHMYIDYNMAFILWDPLSAREPIGSSDDIDHWLISGLIWKMTCYDLFIIYYNIVVLNVPFLKFC